MECRLLGPVEVWDGRRRIDIGPAKQRCVLAILLLDAGRPVPAGTLIDRVWGHRPPDSAINVLYAYMTRLRKVLKPAGVRLPRGAGGYLLDAGRESVDVHRFRDLVAAASGTAATGTARGTPASGEAGRRAALLDEALALWRGIPLANTDSPWLAEVRHALEQQRLAALVDRNEAYLALGRHRQLCDQLPELVAAHPLDERLAGQLMTALYRSGRGSVALDVYRSARRRLVELAGTDPGPALRRLQRQILRGEPLPTRGAAR